ncbi:MAG: gamma-glutamyltransferase [Sphingobacteriales bacterium JAD_PAG50586_3]|nr:MAG: gamma-glutamyltransferase [Sphingobacteriales bacterium JAD_PAG50586_3]
MQLKRVFILLLLICNTIGVLQGQKPVNYSYARKQLVVKDKSMVVTAHPQATQIGLQVLKKGGNAVDAAVAVHFALAVCYPTAGNIGGGGFALYRKADGAFDMLDYRETAPAKASKNMFLDKDGNVIPDLSLSGALCAGVPGSVAGMWDLHQKHGSLPWIDLIQPAIDLANKGFPITEQQAGEFNNHNADFNTYSGLSHYLTNNLEFGIRHYTSWQQGDTLRIPDLGRTLETIRDKGRDGFYTGWVADSIVAQMKRSGGIITNADLAGYKTEWRKPLKGTYRGHTVTTVPPPSAGVLPCCRY